MTSAQHDVVIVTFDGYPTSTRARKAALAYSGSGLSVLFIGMSKAGRTGRWTEPGWRAYEDVETYHAPMREPRTAPTPSNRLRNIVRTYLPAIGRMAGLLWRSRTATVHVVGAPLFPLGLLHKLRHRSRLILDVQERPGQVAATGSATSIFSTVEPAMLQLARRSVDLATTVVEPDAATLRKLGFRNVSLVRNAPPTSWRAEYAAPPRMPTKFVCIGTIFEGRGFESLIRAVGKARHSADFSVEIYGPGRDEYLAQLQDLADSVDASPAIKWGGTLTSHEVSSKYLDAHVGLVLYESKDPGNDGLSNKILECVASGRPVLASDLPQNRAFVSSHNVGNLTKMDEDSIAEALIIMSRADQTETAARCRALGDSWLNWESEFSEVLAAAGAPAKPGH